MEEFFGPVSKLSVDKWLDLVPSSDSVSSETINLRVAASCTLPVPAPHVVQMLSSSSHLTIRSFCVLQSGNSWARFIDAAGDDIIRLKMRHLKRTKGIDNKSLTKEIFGFTKAGETLVVGKLLGQEWSLLDSLWSLKLHNSNDLLLTGPRMVKLIPGRKLDYEPKHHDKRRNEDYFMTAVEFSAEQPYGKAVALLDLKSRLLTVQEEWFALVGLVSAFAVSNHFQKGRI